MISVCAVGSQRERGQRGRLHIIMGYEEIPEKSEKLEALLKETIESLSHWTIYKKAVHGC